MDGIVRMLRDNRSKRLLETIEDVKEEEFLEEEESTNINIEEEEELEDEEEILEVKPGMVLRKGELSFKVLAIKGEYTLVYSEEKKSSPYNVFWNLNPKEVSYKRGYSFQSEEEARKFLQTKLGVLEESQTRRCVCGGTNFILESNEEVCDACGRKFSKNTVRESSPNNSNKIIALRKAVEWWSVGKYQKAVELYKKYGISDREFARALLGSLRESEEEINLDADDIDESLKISPATSFIEKDGEESLRVIINDIEYRYRSESMSVKDLLKKFMGIYKHSVGSALQWLKRNSYVYYNGRTKKVTESKEDDSLAFITPEVSTSNSSLDKNIIRAVQKPVSTVNKPGIDSSLSESEEETNI